jgi:IMP dehydrogenase
MDTKIIADGITFDDVLLIPARSDVLPSETDLSTQLTRGIRLNVPLVSAPMDTVTESSLAIALAQEGGIGIIHKNLSIDTQAGEVVKVKRSENGVITDPITLGPKSTIADARAMMTQYRVSGFPITEDGDKDLRGQGRVVGILTKRDLKFIDDDATPVGDIMTCENLITAAPDTTLEQATRILNTNKVEKLMLVDADFNLAGMITMRDIDRLREFPRASKDHRGRLRVGAAIGVGQLDRAAALIEADVDVIVVDTAHGHSENVLRTIRELRAHSDIQIIAGNVATEQGARDLIEAGVDAVKVGIGPGSICTTRVVTGVGVPQITAVINALKACLPADIPVIADGGIRLSGDIAKALAAGANSVMLGSLFAGLDESPGHMVIHKGRRYKAYRGMGSAGAMMAGSADRYGQSETREMSKFVPEGVEGRVPYRGPLSDFVYQLIGGVRASMGYCGCRTIDDFRRDARFTRVSAASVIESHPHDITITRESPNYTLGTTDQ